MKKGDVMFRIVPILYKAKFDAESAKARNAQLKYDYTKKLADDKVVSQNEVLLLGAEMAEAIAKADLAKAELAFTDVIAPFDGIVDHQYEQLGSLIKEGDVLTTLSDNSVMWVYFNVTEKRYLEYMAETGKNKQSPNIILMLANHSKYPQVGKIGAIESNFNNQTGNIAFRADFPNPEGLAIDGGRLLRHGQTGTVKINRALIGAILIPQRATFENLAKRYVYIVGEDEKVRQREIVVDHELEDIFVIEPGILDVKDKIVLEGIRQVREGDKVEFEFRKPEEVMEHSKYTAE